MKKSWKTSLAGLLGAFLFIAPQVRNCLQGQPCDVRQLALGAAIGGLGLGAKDHDVSGQQK